MIREAKNESNLIHLIDKSNESNESKVSRRHQCLHIRHQCLHIRHQCLHKRAKRPPQAPTTRLFALTNMSSRAHTSHGSRPTKDARRRRAARLPFSTVDYALTQRRRRHLRSSNACDFIITSTLVHLPPFLRVLFVFRRLSSRSDARCARV